MVALDEATLAHAAAAGDGQAFARLYDEYEGRIFNFCLRIVGGREDAADATQDAFVKMLQRLPKLPPGGEFNFGGYLFATARNVSYDLIGKRKRSDPVDLIPEAGARPLDGDERGALDLDPERTSMLSAFQAQVRAANSRLPERHREVLALRELEELSYDEIAEIMVMNRNSVAQLISRARIKLREEMRGVAFASVAAASPECERALPLMAARQDGQFVDEDEREWLDAHVVGCATCKVSIEAMEEAAMSYRAWAPVLPVIGLWKATAAHAMDLTGHDWSALLDRQRERHAGSPSADGGVGSGAAGADAAGSHADETHESGLRHPVGAFAGTLMLVVLALLLFVGGEDVPLRLEAGTVDAALIAPTPTPTPTIEARGPSTGTPITPVSSHHVKPSGSHDALTRVRPSASERASIAPAVGAPVLEPASTSPPTVAAPTRKDVVTSVTKTAATPTLTRAATASATTASATTAVGGSAGIAPVVTTPTFPTVATTPDPSSAATDPSTTTAPPPAPTSGPSYCEQNPSDPVCTPCDPTVGGPSC